MKKLLFPVFIALSLPLFAQDVVQVLSIEQCRELALQHNKTLQSAALGTEAARYTKRATLGLFFPNISLTGMAGYSNTDGSLGMNVRQTAAGMLSTVIPGLPAPIQAQLKQLAPGVLNTLPTNQSILEYELGWMYTGGVMLRQPIFMGGKIIAGYKMSKLALEASRQNERKTRAEVIEEADQAYANVVKATEMKKVAEQYLVLLKQLDSNVESAVRNGVKLQNDRLKVQVKLDEVQLQLTQAENAIRLATMNLCHVTGMPLSSRVAVSSEYPRVDDAALLSGSSDVTSRPEYAMLEAQVQVARQEVNVSRAAWLPQLGLLAYYGYTNGVKINGRKLLDSWGFAGGVTLSVPIFHFGADYFKTKAAKVKAQQVELDRENYVELMQLQLAKEGNNLEESAQEVALTERGLEQATLNRELSEKQYKAGTETLSDLLEAQALWQQAWQRRIEAQFRRYLASVAYLKAAGRLVEE